MSDTGSPRAARVRSLRARLVLLTLAVAAIAVTGVVLLSRIAVRFEYTRLERHQREDRLPAIKAEILRRRDEAARP